MSQNIQEFSEPLLSAAIEANIREFLLVLGRLGGGEERDDATLQWIIGGAPIAYHNCVVHAHLTPDLVDDAIIASTQRFRAHKVPGSWHISPSMYAPDLDQRLLAHGFTSGGSEPGMAADLLKLPRQVPTPSDFTVKQVRTTQDLQIWTQTLAQGFGEGEIEANWIGDMYRAIGFNDHVPWRHYLACWHGKAVATTSLFMSAGVAGIYFVFTVPEARRQGIGAAITLAALQDAQRLGYRVGILGASSMGYPVYQRLGFQQHCSFEVYEIAYPQPS